MPKVISGEVLLCDADPKGACDAVPVIEIDPQNSDNDGVVDTEADGADDTLGVLVVLRAVDAVSVPDTDILLEKLAAVEYDAVCDDDAAFMYVDDGVALPRIDEVLVCDNGGANELDMAAE